MTRPSWYIAALLGPMALLSGCADDRSASTTSETENVVTARELLVDSILPSWIPRGSEAAVATLRLDASHLPFEQTDSVGLDLDFTGADGASLPFEIVSWDRTGRLGRVRLRVEDPATMRGDRVRLSWRRPPAPRGDGVAVWNGITPQRRDLMASLPLDDFEDGDLVGELPSASTWFVDAPKESTSVAPPRVETDPAGGTGRSLVVDFVADRAKFRYVVVGIDLGSVRPLSFRGLDSLTLDVRGPTRLTVQLEHLGSGQARKAWVHRDLDSGWTRVRVRPDDFLPADSAVAGLVGWEGVRDSIDALTFLLSGGTKVRFDNIRLHGLNQDDLR